MSTSKTKTSQTIAKLGRGRPRSPETRAKILKAAYEMMIEVGFMDLTIEGVAAKAEVGKPTIYRRTTHRYCLEKFRCSRTTK